MKKNVVKKTLPLEMALLQGIKNLFGPLLMTWTADSLTRRYRELATISTNSNSKASVRDLCWPESCENIGKFGSLP